MILHFSHIGLTEGLTFILGASQLLLASPDDPAAVDVIRRHLYRNLVAGENSDKIHPELTGNMRQDNVSIADIDLEHRVGQ